MILNDEHKKVVAGKINQMWKKSKECGICGEEKWSLSDKIFSLSQFGPESQKGKQMYPVVVLTCETCGNTLLFNAMSLGFSFTPNTAENEDKPLN